MWTTIFVRILRRRIVLTIIFSLSLIYCLFSFWQEKSPDQSYSNRDGDSTNPRLLFLWHGDVNDGNNSNAQVTSCRNSVQGKELIVDERGYICARGDVGATGCCNIEAEATRRFACDTCQSSGCCSVYEYCISCCLQPDKKQVLQNVLGKAPDSVLFASVADHFELCLAKCRTSSQSVRHENSYRDPSAKHCYGETPISENAPS